MLELDFIPYQLYHTHILTNVDDEDVKEVVWLLSGSDEKIHMFQEDRMNHCYSQVDTVAYFPEFSDIPSVAIWMDILYDKQFAKRVSVYGCECGFVKLSVVDPHKKEVLSSWTTRFGGSVTSVRLFTIESDLKPPSFLKCQQEQPIEEESKLNLLVTNSLQASVIYMNVKDEGLSSCHTLPRSGEFDSVLCSCVADINMDGEQEILLGTYGQEMPMYKFVSNSWVLSGRRTFANPIHSILYIDVTGDGVKELVVLSLRGVHILQHDPDIVSEKLLASYQEIDELFGSLEVQ